MGDSVAARRRLLHRRRLPGDPVHAAGLRLLGHFRQERHRGDTRLCPRPVPDRLDIEGARNELLGRGVEITEVFHDDAGVYAGTDQPYLFGRRRVSGRDPEHRSYRSFASFSDPDGNGWLLQEITTRLPGRIDPAEAPTNVQFMVKDSTKYASTGGWGVAQFKDGKPADEALLKTCFACHVPVKSRDYVFTRYAP